MGGFYGHIDHVFDDQSLTFFEVKDIFKRLFEGDLPYTEKFDGTNIYFSVDPSTRSLLYCRNKSDFQNQGVIFQEFIERYSDTSSEEVFRKFHESINTLVDSMPDSDLSDLFESRTFYNTEIIHPSFEGVIKYNTFKVVIQQTGHKSHINENIELPENLDIFKRYEGDFLLINKIRTSKLDVNDKLNEVMDELRSSLCLEGMKPSNTIGDYATKRMLSTISSLEIPPFKQKMLAKKLVGRKGIRLNHIYAGLSPAVVAEIRRLVGDKRNLLRKAVAPIKEVVDKAYGVFLEHFTPGIQTESEIKSEGIVFDYNDKTFKLTGQYAELIREKNTKTKKKVALIPGSFKPPHRGHLAMFEHYSSICDEVYVVVSNVARKCSFGREYTIEQTGRVLKEFLSVGQLDNVTFIFDDHPHRKTISLLNDPSVVKPDSLVFVGASSKGGDHDKGAYIYADRDDVKLLNAEETNYSIKEDLSSTHLRDYISNGESDKIKYFIPEGLEHNRYMEIFGLSEISEKKTTESTDPLSSLDEESVSANVQGHAGGKKGPWINREEFMEEMKIREGIRNVIENIQKQQSLKEQRLRKIVRKMLLEKQVSDLDPAPSSFTGINVLEDLLKKIVPILEVDYKKLTTSREQRESFRSHVVKGIENLLTPVEITSDADEETVDAEDKFIDVLEEDELEEDVVVKIGGEKFIDVDKKEKSAEEEEEDELGAFTIKGKDLTGRNMAYDTFKRISSNIIDAYDVLSDDKDKEVFYDYLITNAKLYFDKFEDELAPNVVEPTTPEYEEQEAADA
jgi:cytidyltransferase-like protein